MQGMSRGESKVDGTTLKYQKPDLEDFTMSIHSCLSLQKMISNSAMNRWTGTLEGGTGEDQGQGL